MKAEGIKPPKVLLFNQASTAKTQWTKDLSPRDYDFMFKNYNVAGHEIKLAGRAMNFHGNFYRVRSVHLGNPDDEKLFLTEEQRSALIQSKRKSVNHDYIASEHRDFAGLKIYFFAVSSKSRVNEKDTVELIHGHEATLGYTVSFPRTERLKNKTPQQIKALIKTTKHSYFINKIQEKNLDLQAYEDLDEEEPDDR